MENLEVLTYEQASPEAKEIFDSIKKKFGKVPNIYATIAHSPVALKAFLQYGDALKSGQFTPKEIEAIALVVGEVNDCAYCLAAHTALGKLNGFSEEETIKLRTVTIEDPKLRALTVLTKEIISTNGYPPEVAVEAFFEAGYNKAALVELIAVVSLNLFTNIFNHVASTKIDFPAAPQLEAV